MMFGVERNTEGKRNHDIWRASERKSLGERMFVGERIETAAKEFPHPLTVVRICIARHLLGEGLLDTVRQANLGANGTGDEGVYSFTVGGPREQWQETP